MNAVVFAERWCFTADTDAARPCSSLRRCDLWRQAAHDDIAMHLDLWAKDLVSQVAASDENPSRIHWPTAARRWPAITPS